MADDPFDRGALRASIKFKLTDAQWAAFVAECGFTEAKGGIGVAFTANRPHERHTGDINKVLVFHRVAGKRIAVPLRTEIESALRDFHARQEFRKRYPAATQLQIAQGLEALHDEMKKARFALCEPFSVTFASADERRVTEAAIEALENKIKADIAALKESGGLPDSIGAPKDGEGARGWQRVHRELNRDPQEALIHRLRDLSVWVLGGTPGTSNEGLTAQFIKAAARPVTTLGKIRETLRKLRAAPSLYPLPRVEARPEDISPEQIVLSRPRSPRRSSDTDGVS